MRSITLDIETTGLSFLEGHKIVEIGCVELLNNFPSGKTWQRYINPERPMPEEAFKIHGLSDEFLFNKPVFSDIIDDFLNFIKDSDLIIHNSRFDLPFINYELEINKSKALDPKKNKIIDTLNLARKMYPGQSVSLDALSRRYKINIERENHGALLDAEILAEVYLEMNGGRQKNIILSERVNNKKKSRSLQTNDYSKKIYVINDQEEKKHQELLDFINNL
ncbi:MAG: DNA polymerase III subunit epsilon [Alphaproteobacteria bacterium TMED194]|nr:MAG: DNA polymerase III subunit epsilon [Alphaproteobacteria bacterium TMED194]